MIAIVRRRSGVTLMEVMIAAAILSVGLVCIMAFFPIGAVNFARALNQDRCTTHGVNSDAMFRLMWGNAWVERETNPLSPNYGVPTGSICGTNEAAYQNSQEPMLLMLEAHPSYLPISRGVNQPSFPVLVDPIGWRTKAGNLTEQGFVAGNSALPVRTTFRRNIQPLVPATVPFPRQAPDPTLPPPAAWNYPLFPQAANPLPTNFYYTGSPPFSQPYLTDTQSVLRYTTLLDDMTFDQSSEPSIATGQIDRGGRYTASFLIQRARNDVPTDVDVKVLVFGGRSPTDTPSAETAYSAAGAAPGSKNITILLGGQAPPALRRGAWLAFSMVVPPPTHPGGTLLEVPYPTMDFYRVVSVDDSSAPGVAIVVELETPIKQQPAAAGLTYTGTAIVFDNLIEVYERGVASPLATTTK